MPNPRIGSLPPADRAAIFEAAQKLKLNPYELGGFLSLESGTNMDPNIWGGEGGKHYGLIQFGPGERAKYLNPSRIGKYTRAEQMPSAVQFLLDRGYKPGMGIERAYATVLGGNPNVSLGKEDSFGTSVSSAAKRFRQGGDLYENARRVLGDLPSFGAKAEVPNQQTNANANAETTPFKVKPFDFNEALNETISKNLIASTAVKTDAPNEYLQASSLLQLASNLEDSDDPRDQDTAEIYRSQAMSAMVKTTPMKDPIDLVNSYLNVAKEEQGYNQAASDLEQLVNNIRQGNLAQNAGKNIETAAKPSQGVAYTGVSITNPNDTGGKGVDFVIEGGKRGAKFVAPFQAEVLKVVKDPREFNLEKGATARGYGNNVELRFKTPQGKVVDTLIAHFDELNQNLKPGDVINPGTYIGTQGRTGSTTGAHISMDFFNPGSTSADAEVMKIKDLFIDRIRKGLPVFG